MLATEPELAPPVAIQDATSHVAAQAGATWSVVRITGAAGWWLAFAGGSLLAGFVLGRPALAGFGSVALAALAVRWVRTTLLAAQAMRAGAGASIGLAPLLPADGEQAPALLGKSCVVGREVQLQVTLDPAWGVVDAVRAAHSPSLQVAADSSVLHVRPLAAGPHSILGLHLRSQLGAPLFRTEFFCPTNWQFQALPRAAARPQPLPLAASRLRFRTAEGAISSVRPGSGLELRELRELLPGDPFRAVDWKASARLGKLIVRERESDVTLSAWLVADASSTMMKGAPGNRSVDWAIEWAFGLGRALARQRDTLGAAVIRGSQVQFGAPAAGRSGFLRATQTLLGAVSPPESAELSSEVAEELAHRLSMWARHSGRLGVGARAEPLESCDMSGLDGAPPPASALGRWLARWGFKPAPGDDPLDNPTYGELSPRLHAAAAAAGLPLAPKLRHTAAARDAGLTDALRRVAAAPGGPHTAIVFSDLNDIPAGGSVTAAVRQMRRHGHQILFLLVDAALAPPRSDFAGAQGLTQLLQVGQHEDRGALVAKLLQAGAQVHLALPSRPAESAGLGS